MDRTLRALSAVVIVLSAGCSGGKDKNESTQAPFIESVSPATGIVGTSVTISGEDFGGDQGASTVTIGGAVASVTTWDDDTLIVSVPAGAFPGERSVVVTTEDGDSNALPFAVTLPRALYVNDDIVNDNSVEALSIDASNVATPMAGSPYLQGINGPQHPGDGGTLAMDIPRRRFFTVADERLVAWSIDGATGVLTSTGSLALSGGDNVYGLTLSNDGTKIYGADFNNGRIFGASVASDGTIAALAGSPFPAGMLTGTSKITLSMDGAFLYLNNESNGFTEILGFAVDGAGALDELASSPYNNPGVSFAFVRAPNADRHYVSIPGYITAYEPDTAGALVENVALRESVPGPLYLAFSSDGARLFAVGTNQLNVFDVVGTGELVAVAGSPFTLAGVTDASHVRPSQDGTLLLVKSSTAAEVHLYTLSAAGAPTEVSGSPFDLRTSANTTYGSGIAFSF